MFGEARGLSVFNRFRWAVGLRPDWLFRIRITCSDEMKDSITSYIEYMIHSVSSDQNEVG